jgi:hypothetical protein
MLTNSQLTKLVKEHHRSYIHLANIVLNGNSLRIVNRYTGTIHPFTGYGDEIKLNSFQLKLVKETLSEEINISK